MQIPTILENLLKLPFQHADFSDMAKKSDILNTLSALNLFVAWIKVFKYLSFNATMTQLSQTLTSVSTEIYFRGEKTPDYFACFSGRP